MKFTADKRDMMNALGLVQGVANKKTPIQSLSCVLIRANKNIEMFATDLITSVTAVAIASSVDNTGAVAVPAKDMFDRVKAMPDGQVIVDATNSKAVTIKAGGTSRKFILHGLPADDFPPAPEMNPGKAAMVLSVAELSGLIERTHFAIHLDPERANLNSALLEWGEGLVRMVATSGHRMSVASIATDVETAGSALISLSSIQDLRKFVASAGASEEVTVAAERSSMTFSVGDATFGTKLVDSTYPPYQQVIPAEGRVDLISVPRRAFAEAIQSISLAASGDIDASGTVSGAGVTLAVEGSRMLVSSQSARGGVASDDMLVTYKGKYIKARLDPKYMLDVLNAIADDDVAIDIESDTAPMVIRAAGAVFVVMPMRL